MVVLQSQVAKIDNINATFFPKTEHDLRVFSIKQPQNKFIPIVIQEVGTPLEYNTICEQFNSHFFVYNRHGGKGREGEEGARGVMITLHEK